jgi:hypothetical protein
MAELNSVGELARPLVLFYGVMALSRAAILFFEPGAREENLQQGHGLAVHSWQQTLAAGIKAVPDLVLKPAKGTFVELADSTRRIDRATVFMAPHPNVMSIRQANEGVNGALPRGWSVTLRDLLGRIPDLHDLYEETFQEHAPCLRVFVLLLVGRGPFQTSIDVLATRMGLPAEERVRRDLHLDPAETLTTHGFHRLLGYEIEHWSVQQPRESQQDVLDRLPFLVNDGEGDLYVVPDVPQGPRLSKLLLLYATSFALGMLARYYPSRWVGLLTGRAGDFAYPLLAEASRVIEDVFPQTLATEFRSTD